MQAIDFGDFILDGKDYYCFIMEKYDMDLK